MISNIIDKEFHSINSPVNILWTQPESLYFTDFIREACSPCSLVDFDKTYYGNNNISLVVCNNRLVYIDKCVELSKFFHAPLLIIDHSNKSSIINENFVLDVTFEPVYQLAISKDIYLSWGKVHNLILEYNSDKNTMDKWKNIVFQLIKTRFLIKEDNNENKTK